MRPLPLRAGVGLLGKVVEVVDDPLGADDHGAVLEHQHRHRTDAGVELEHVAFCRVGGHLARDEVDPELGQPLPDRLRAAAPLGLEELEHGPSVTAPAARGIGPPADRRCEKPAAPRFTRDEPDAMIETL